MTPHNGQHDGFNANQSPKPCFQDGRGYETDASDDEGMIGEGRRLFDDSSSFAVSRDNGF